MTTPNEPNKARTIPLHIADQAVAACEAEIQKLREENARLKEKSACQTECLDAFDKKLREADEMVALMKQKWEWATPSQISEGITLLVENKRLKAEVERLTQNTDKLCKHGDLEIERLKAEVEAYRSASDEVAAAFLALPAPHNQVARVCEGIESLKAEVERLQDSVHAKKVAIEAGCYARINLEAKIERLIKAGDACSNEIENLNEDIGRDYPSSKKAVSDWNAAKEGKQS